MTLAPVRLSEAADSLAKASTPEPFSASRTSNWVARGGGLPDYIQHIAHDLMEKRGKSESNAIQMAVGIVKRWAAGGGKVDAGTRAAAAKAVAEWERLKAGSKAKSALQHSWVAGADRYRPTLADERMVEQDAMARIVVFEEQFGIDGLVGLLAEGSLAEAEAWKPTLKRTASAPDEMERHEVYDGGQHCGTIAARRAYDPGKPPRWAAFAVNGTRVTDYNTTSRPDALKALQSHLEEAPARVVTLPAAGKFLVATPSTYSGDTTYRSFSSEPAARHAAGLPPQPTVPERNSKVEAIAEMLRFDLMSVSSLDVPPLRRVQEARRRDPFDLLAEAFSASELRDFRGRWRGDGRGEVRLPAPARGLRVTGTSYRARPHSPASVAPRAPRARVASAAAVRYEGGVSRASARARAAHAAKPQIALKDLAGAVGRGSWSSHAARATSRMLKQPVMGHDALHKAIRAGSAVDTEHAHRVRNPDGSLGAYTAERQAFHERILSALLQGKQSHTSPEAIFTAGGPASGKSSLEKHGLLKLPGDVVHANPDVIREMLPEYKALADAGREDAAGLTHEEASYLAKLVTRVAMGRQHHLFVDGVGDSEAGKFAGKVKAAQEAGYKASVHYATVPVSEAIQRAKARGDGMKARGEIPRYVSNDVIRAGHRGVSQRFGEIAALPGVHVRVFDTSGPASTAPRLLSEKLPTSDKLDIKDRAGQRRFLDKGR